MTEAEYLNRCPAGAWSEWIDGTMLIEVVSTDSLSRDYGEKFIEYEKMGVREYWIVDPLSKNVEAFSRGRNGKFRLIAEKSERMASKALRGFFLKPSWLWKKRLPKVSAIFREIGPEA